MSLPADVPSLASLWSTDRFPGLERQREGAVDQRLVPGHGGPYSQHRVRCQLAEAESTRVHVHRQDARARGQGAGENSIPERNAHLYAHAM